MSVRGSLENVAIVFSGQSKAQGDKIDFVAINGVDGDFINGVRTLYLSPGSHSVGYMCPGWGFLIKRQKQKLMLQ